MLTSWRHPDRRMNCTEWTPSLIFKYVRTVDLRILEWNNTFRAVAFHILHFIIRKIMFDSYIYFVSGFTLTLTSRIGSRLNDPHFYMAHEPTCILETTNLLNRTQGRYVPLWKWRRSDRFPSPCSAYVSHWLCAVRRWRWWGGSYFQLVLLSLDSLPNHTCKTWRKLSNCSCCR
jgi:hypothetical protein